MKLSLGSFQKLIEFAAKAGGDTVQYRSWAAYNLDPLARITIHHLRSFELHAVNSRLTQRLSTYRYALSTVPLPSLRDTGDEVECVVRIPRFRCLQHVL